MLFKLKSWYKIHKWVSIVTGVLILMWLGSGVVMVSPNLLPGLWSAVQRRPLPPPRYDWLLVSPSDAIRLVDAEANETVSIKEVKITQIGGELFYRVVTIEGDAYFVNIGTSEVAVMNSEFAQKIATEQLIIEGKPVRAERLDRHDFAYVPSEGPAPLPAYRIVFDDDRATYAHVIAETGDVRAIDRQGRSLLILESLHTFKFLQIVFGEQERLTTTLLWTSILLTLSAAIVGYYLALPQKRSARPLR